ncbi:hypothetical protein OA973_00145 [Candidatus Pelagibacter sp.]|nr:hypothetical protein [Candidatus Pelagibacter sp.]
MKILKLLNDILLLILLILISNKSVYSEEAVDIWNIKVNKNDNNQTSGENEILNSNNNIIISGEEILDKTVITVNEDSNLFTNKNEIVGIYDPEINDLSIDMWKKTDGVRLSKTLNKIFELKLSNDSRNILNISLLTNSYSPTNNISFEEFVDFKNKWLIKNADLNLVKVYLEKNNSLKFNDELIKYYVDHNLSKTDLKKACEIFDNNLNTDNKYLVKFNIYCLINENKVEESLMRLDLLQEAGFTDSFFEQRVYKLIGYEDNIKNEVNEKNILNFHLSHRLNEDFIYEPNISSPKFIWRYLASANLLSNIDDLDIENKEKILALEKATHDKNYPEDKLFSIYEKFLFNINQYLNISETYKLLHPVEGRALLYQGSLIFDEPSKKISILKDLKESFKESGTENAFEIKLSKFLMNIDEGSVPSNYTKFYKKNLKSSSISTKSIKINNKVIHQSKLLKYFSGESSLDETKKNLENIFKDTIKRDKNYIFSMKDIIIIESLRSDGIEIPNKYKNLYNITKPEIPEQIQKYIDNDEKGMSLLKLVELIREDRIKDLGSDSLYFIIETLNKLKINKLRNSIILDVVPLKV